MTPNQVKGIVIALSIIVGIVACVMISLNITNGVYWGTVEHEQGVPNVAEVEDVSVRSVYSSAPKSISRTEARTMLAFGIILLVLIAAWFGLSLTMLLIMYRTSKRESMTPQIGPSFGSVMKSAPGSHHVYLKWGWYLAFIIIISATTLFYLISGAVNLWYWSVIERQPDGVVGWRDSNSVQLTRLVASTPKTVSHNVAKVLVGLAWFKLVLTFAWFILSVVIIVLIWKTRGVRAIPLAAREPAGMDGDV